MTMKSRAIGCIHVDRAGLAAVSAKPGLLQPVQPRLPEVGQRAAVGTGQTNSPVAAGGRVRRDQIEGLSGDTHKSLTRIPNP